jgi:transposase, IS30 family
MGQKYSQLSATERNEIHSRLVLGESRRSIARALGRSASTISREISRNIEEGDDEYDSCRAGYARRWRRRRGLVKLPEGSALRDYVFGGIRLGWSPQQICGKLRQQRDQPERASQEQGCGLPTVSHETIYQAIYVLPRGEIRRELISFLRQRHSERLPLRRRANKRGGLIGMISIHERPAEVLTRAVAGDWEGDFIKGAGNASAIGTLIERKSRFTILVKMKDCSSRAALSGFKRELGKVPAAMRLSMAYDQGTEMARHDELSKALKIKVYFCDPHSPWQRPSNENMNGLVRQYLPKGCDLSIYSQRDLDAISQSLNTRPRACLGFQTPEEVFAEECRKLEQTRAA